MKKRLVVVGVVVLVLGVAGFFAMSSSLSPRPLYPLTLVEGDAVSSWDFAGAYSSSPELRQRAQDEIKRLNKLFGTRENTNYTLYVSIANQYDLLGDGAQELSYLRSALAEDATSTGLAWHNAGQLLDRLNAVQTARMAFEKAVEAQPIPQYVNALSDFLVRRSLVPFEQKK